MNGSENKSTVSPITRIMNWVKDGNLKSPFPKDETKGLSPIFLLTYFLQSPDYFIFINDVFNNYGLFYLSLEDVFTQLKTMYFYTRYSSYSPKKPPKQTENQLIGILKQKYPYFKKEEIVMLVNIIDNSEFKDVVYEQFGVKSVKAKKTTEKEKKNIKKKISDILSKDDIEDLM